jgi:acyl transferase domain-containing protein
VPVGGPVDGVDRLDAAAFGLTPREAQTMEPHHRLLLECAWEALERAGYCPTDPGLPVGVFAGAAFPDYLTGNVPGLAAEPGGPQYLAAGVERDSLTSLISYKLGLRGPSLTVQTYCSTSLVAVHLACQSLLVRECDLALAGGAFLPLPQPAGYRYEDGGILSPDGRARSLDAAASGTVMGSGVAVVALRRLSDALADGDVVHAVILGSAVNNDGRDRAGYAAPGVAGQAAVIDTALAVADVKPESVGYVECHAVGTPLGDSIEVAALGKVFSSPRETPCVLSSVKPSIGHLDRAAGATGLVRAALSLRHRVLPGTAGFEAPSPALAGAADRFTVLTRDRAWPAGPEPRRAGVSSFGLGGTNAHVVLEEAPERPHLLTFSAGDGAALAELTGLLRDWLAGAADDCDLADVAYTLAVSRGRFALRRAVVVADRADAVAALADPGRWIDGETRRRDPLARLVPGPGLTAAREAELAAAVRLLVDGMNVAGTGAAGLDVLAGGLGRLGVRLAGPGETAVTDISVAPDGGTAAEWLLGTVARLWQAGSVIGWAGLHAGRGRRVELPSYPFQRQRHWIDPPAVGPGSGATMSNGGADEQPSRWQVPTWRPCPQPVAGLDRRLRAAGPWLVLAADDRGRALAGRLAYAGAEVVTVRPGAAFAADEAGDFTIRPAHPGDLAVLLGSLIATPRTVVHGFSLAGDDPAGDVGAASAAALAGALAAATALPPADLILLTGGAVGVLGPDLGHPEHAAFGVLAARLSGRDQPRDCRHVDIGPDADLDQVLAAMVSRAPSGDPGRVPAGPAGRADGAVAGSVAVRSDQAWARVFEPCPVPGPEPAAGAGPERALPPVLPTDTVLIIGGLSGPGLALARRLADRYRCRLALTACPAEADRGERAAEVTAELARLGASALIRPADPGNGRAMRDAVRAAVEAWGEIDLAIWADPDADAGARGFRVLQSVLARRAARRLLLCPPGAAVLAAYAQQARARGAGRWTVIEPAGPVPAGDLAEAADALLGAAHLGHVLVGAGQDGRSAAAGQPGLESRTLAAGPAGRGLEPGDELERGVAAVWAASLGLAEVGVEDNFFDLGGRSSAAVQIAARLQADFSPALPVTAVLEYPTVRLLSARIAELAGHPGDGSVAEIG